MKYTIRKFGIMAFALGAILIAGCQKQDSVDVNQDKIYVRYEMDYNANLDVTDVIARFTFGGPLGTLLDLSDSTGAYCLFNGDTLHYDDFYFGLHKEYAGKITSGTFQYRNTQGHVYTNTIPAGDTIAFPPTLTTIQKSVANTLTWVGKPLASDESVGIFVGSWAWGNDAAFYTNQVGATNIVMNLAQKSNLALGNADLYMDRAMQKPAAEVSSVGGVLVYQFICKKQSVVVVN